jgi:hypothetical protein
VLEPLEVAVHGAVEHFNEIGPAKPSLVFIESIKVAVSPAFTVDVLVPEN